MFDSFSNGGQTGRFSESYDPSEGLGNRGQAGASFGGIASYDVCGCCARFHGAASSGGGTGGQGVIINADDRGTVGPNGKPSLSPGDAGTQITRNDWSWASGFGQAATVTYAFRMTAPATMPNGTAGFSQFTATQIQIAELAFAAWADVAQITFNRVSDGDGTYSNNATILLGNYSSGAAGAAAFAYLPAGMPGQTGVSQNAGDVWVNITQGPNANPALLNYGSQTLLHEIGHAIGLSHPAAYNASEGVNITYAEHATYFEDSRQYTVMSYFREQETGGNFRANGVQYYSSAPLMDDIAAAQRLYGANMTTRTGDTTYGFNSTAGQPWFSATSGTSTLIFCVWDAGGVDTLDFSGYSQNATIDLRQGTFSSVGGMLGNVSIALGAVIENAIGGAGADTIRGNAGDNRLTGGGGNDTIDGGLGSDTVVFSGARSAYTISWNGQVGTVSGPGGTVTVTNVEFLQFSDQTIAAAPTGGLVVGGDITNNTINGSALGDTLGGLGGDDTINGLNGADILDGGSGSDTLNGGDGDDTLVGGLGNDTLNGGAGSDTADYSGAASSVTVDLAAGVSSGGAGSDALSGVENITGTTRDDILTGDANANVIRGGGGVDVLNGGGGGDQLYSGTPGEAGGGVAFEKRASTANNSIGTAVSLAGRFGLQSRPDIGNSESVPHATVQAITHGGMEYYAITVAAGETVTFDIDNANFDSTLRIFDGANVELAANDDDASDGGPQTDSRLVHTFATAGTYYVQVAQWNTNPPGGLPFTSKAPNAGLTYTLHVSSPSAPVTPVVLTGSTLNGEAGDDRLEGAAGKDQLNGGDDDDVLIGGGDNDTLNGGQGRDTAVFSGLRSAYTISTVGGVTTVTGPDGTDTLTNIERLQFSNGVFGIDGAPIVGGPIEGTANPDTLVGTAEDDVINGQAGDDGLYGRAGADQLNGGLGRDLLAGEDGADTLRGGAGGDSLYGGVGDDAVYGEEDDDYASGGDGNDYIEGGDGADELYGDAGADRILGGLGLDRLYGGDGNDVLEGGDGGDIMIAGAGGDIVMGGTGDDYVNAGDGDNFANGEDGADVLVGGIGADHFLGGAGADTLQGGDGVNRLEGGEGGDILYGGADGDTLLGQNADDYVAAGGGDDYVNGGAGFDVLHGQAGADIMLGAEDNDFIFGGAGRDTLDGGDGDDWLEGGDDGDVLLGGAGRDTIAGGAGDDYVNAGEGDSYVTGDDGADVLVGGSGADHFLGGVGADVLQGGNGVNRLEGGDDGDTLYGGSDADTLLGQNGDDYIVAGDGADYVHGEAGLDVIHGQGGNDVLLGGDGNDYVYGGTGQDRLEGGEGGDLMYGEDDADVLLGDGGDDALSGGAGDDVLVGGAGFDYLAGGAGNDELTGGEGDDTFVVRSGEGSDRILDFGAGGASGDIIQLVGTGWSSFAQVSSNATQNGADVVINLGGGQTLTLVGVNLASLNENDFAFAAAAPVQSDKDGAQVLPALSDDKGGPETFGPDVMPMLDDDPFVLPAVADDKAFPTFDDAQVLPGVDDVPASPEWRGSIVDGWMTDGLSYFENGFKHDLHLVDANPANLDPLA